jgi:hypothetical protein
MIMLCCVRFFRCVHLHRLHTRGLKTLKDRTRLQAVEFRLGELARDISQVRKDLSAKPN